MKKHYFLEILFLLVLSVAAASLAADHHFYELIWEKFGLDKQHLEDAVAWVRITGFFAVVVFSAINIGTHLHTERKIVESLLAAVHKGVFRNINLTDSTSDRIHRITCHKYYQYNWGRTLLGCCLFILATNLIGILFTKNTASNSNRLLLWILSIILSALIFYAILKAADAWWYQFLLRVRKLGWKRSKWNRLLIPGKSYFLSYARYGYESGVPNRENTTMPFLVNQKSRSSRLFTGLVYDADEEIKISKDHNGINELIKKLNRARQEDPDSYQAENESFRKYLSYPFETNVEMLGRIPSFTSSLTPIERERLIWFMRDTNTLAYDLFDINHIRHCEHFLGFKIQRKDSASENLVTWGVVVIDILANSTQNFYEYLGFEEDDRWLQIFLSSYSKLFSEAIIPTNKNDLS